ncbi:hypothetical protein [Legionella fairfieldensis]|uniref:hypothetical protein n=1 Tax=Legionella fairfieldensis TaxID=45064 RepID=UPI000491805D|nr:hypothetical protein [Legionella fairfieldensis]
MKLDELTFFKLQARLLCCSRENASIFSTLDSYSLLFISSNLNLSFKQLKTLNPKKTAALLGELYDQPIKDNYQQIKQQLKGLLPTLLKTSEYRKGGLSSKVSFRANYFPAIDIANQTPDYLNGYEEKYTIKLLNSTKCFHEKGIRLGALARCLNKKSLEEMEFVKYSGNSQIRGNPEFLSGFKIGMENPNSVLKKYITFFLRDNHTDQCLLSTATLPAAENNAPVVIFSQESPATRVQCPSTAHSSLENGNTVDNCSSLETRTSYTTPNSTVTTTQPSLRQENDNDFPHSDGEMALPVRPFQQTEKSVTVSDNPGYQKNNDYGIQVANNTPSPPLNNQEREENPLNQPTLPASKTPQNNASSVVATQSPMTRPYSISNSIPWEKSSLNSTNANKTRSGQTRASIAENPCHFFQNPWASLPSSSLNPLTYAQGHAKKRKLIP